MATPDKTMPLAHSTGQAVTKTIAPTQQTTNALLDKQAAIRELSENKLKILLAVADLPTQQLIGLLLSGVRPDELETLMASNFTANNKTVEQQIKLTAYNPRTLLIPSVLQQLFSCRFRN